MPAQETPQADTTSRTLVAALDGKACSCGKVVGVGRTPVLNLCRKLIAAGVDPNTALDVFRDGTLALQVRSVGEAAGLGVRDQPGTGKPIFYRLQDHSEAYTSAPPVRFSEADGGGYQPDGFQRASEAAAIGDPA